MKRMCFLDTQSSAGLGETLDSITMEQVETERRMKSPNIIRMKFSFDWAEEMEKEERERDLNLQVIKDEDGMRVVTATPWRVDTMFTSTAPEDRIIPRYLRTENIENARDVIRNQDSVQSTIVMDENMGAKYIPTTPSNTPPSLSNMSLSQLCAAECPKGMHAPTMSPSSPDLRDVMEMDDNNSTHSSDSDSTTKGERPKNSDWTLQTGRG